MPWVFAYGTLLSAGRQRRLFGRRVPCEPAVLEGWRRARCVGRYLGIVRRAGSRTSGGLLRLSRAELAAADAYEDAPRLYRRVRLRVLAGGRARASWAYVPARRGPGRL